MRSTFYKNLSQTILLIGLLLVGLNTKADSRDSLFNVYQDNSLSIDTRLSTLSSIVHSSNDLGTDSTLKLINNGIKLAEKHNNYKYQVIFTRKNAEIYNYQLQDFDKAKELYLETIKLCDKVERSISRPILYKGLADMHMYQNKMEEAKRFYEKSIKFANELKEPMKFELLASTYISYGNYYNNNNEFRKAINISKKAQLIFEKLKSPNANIAIGNIGAFYNRLGKYDSALYYYRSIPTDPNNLNSSAVNNYNIGMIFQNMNFHDSCLLYYSNAYNQFKEVGNKRGQSSSLHGLGIEYSGSGNQKKAIELFKKAIEICKETKNTKSLHANYRMIGQSYLKLKDIENAKTYFTKSSDLSNTEFRNPTILAQSFMDFGNLEIENENWENAIINYDSAIHYYSISGEQNLLAISKNKKATVLIVTNKYSEAIMVLKSNFPYIQNQLTKTSSSTFKLLSNAYNGMNKTDSAYQYLLKYNAAQDSILGRTDKEIESKIRMEFAIELNNKDKEIAKQQAKKERNLKYFGFGLFGLTLVSLFLIITRHKKYKAEKEKSNALKIENSNQKLSLTKEILHNQSHLILEKNRIIKDLKDNIESFLGQKIENTEHLDNLLEQKILTKQDWENFRNSFLLLHPDFIVTAHKQYSGLSENEERILCLKKLGLTREEIANMLGVMPDSVKKASNRFKNKYNLIGTLAEIIDSLS